MTLIALKREVALEIKVFRGANVKLGNWRQVTVQQNISATAEKACAIFIAIIINFYVIILGDIFKERSFL